VLNKNNFFQRALTFYTNYCGGTEMEVLEVVAMMINSNKYIFSSHMLMQSNGQMREATAQVMACFSNLTSCTIIKSVYKASHTLMIAMACV
jgi:hypothetical protein